MNIITPPMFPRGLKDFAPSAKDDVGTDYSTSAC
jgi:hypothetical protein